MGVKGLLPALQSITKQVSLEKYRGLTAAIDAMCWLHKGIFTGDVASLAKYQFLMEKVDAASTISTEDASKDMHDDCSDTENDLHPNGVPVKRLDFDHCLAQRKQGKKESARNKKGNTKTNLPDHIVELKNNANKAVSVLVAYVIRQTMILRNEFGIEPILIVDGDELPSKSRTNSERKLTRVKAFEQAMRLERKQIYKEARNYFAKACSITHEIRHELILQCRLQKISYIIAPYEADAQLASIAHSGVADFVITEDSDLLVYAVPRVLFKVDLKMGRGDEIQIMRDLASNEDLDFRHWNHDMFVYMCILSGCDYCGGLPGLGLKMAHKLVRIHRNPSKILGAIKRGDKWRDGFEDDFWIAYRTFRHQRVFCTQSQVIRNLFPIQNYGAQRTEYDIDRMWSFLGEWMETALAVEIANGSFHPREKLSWNEVIRKKEAEWNYVFHSTDSIQYSLGIDNFIGAIGDRHLYKSETMEKKRSYISPVKENIFSFFRPKKRSSTAVEKQDRIPLKEIHVKHLPDYLSFTVCQHINGKAHYGAVSCSNSYSSSLVSKTFQPISCRSKLQGTCDLPTKKSGVTRAIFQLKERLSIKKVQEREKEKTRDNLMREQEDQKEIQVQMVQSDSNDIINNFEDYHLFDYGLDSSNIASGDLCLEGFDFIQKNYEREISNDRPTILPISDPRSHLDIRHETENQYDCERHSTYNYPSMYPDANYFDYL